MAHLTMSEYARHFGVTSAYISQLVKAGDIPIVQTDEGRRIDPATADPIMSAKRNRGQSHLLEFNKQRRALKAVNQINQATKTLGAISPPTSEVDDLLALPGDVTPKERAKSLSGVVKAIAIQENTYQEARAARERFAAKTAEVEYRKMVGDLVERDAVERALGDLATQTRLLVERLPDRAAERIAAALGVDPANCHVILNSEVRRLCTEISQAAASLPERLNKQSQPEDE